MESEELGEKCISESAYILAKYRLQVVDTEKGDQLAAAAVVDDEVEDSHEYHMGPKALGKTFNIYLSTFCVEA